MLGQRSWEVQPIVMIAAASENTSEIEELSLVGIKPWNPGPKALTLTNKKSSAQQCEEEILSIEDVTNGCSAAALSRQDSPALAAELGGPRSSNAV